MGSLLAEHFPDAATRVETAFLLQLMAAFFLALVPHTQSTQPIILGTTGTGRDAISVGLWAFEEDIRPRLLAKAGVSCEVSRYWYDRSFGAERSVAAAVA